MLCFAPGNDPWVGCSSQGPWCAQEPLVREGNHHRALLYARECALQACPSTSVGRRIRLRHGRPFRQVFLCQEVGNNVLFSPKIFFIQKFGIFWIFFSRVNFTNSAKFLGQNQKIFHKFKIKIKIIKFKN